MVESLSVLNVWIIWKFEGLSDLKIENEFARIILLEMIKQTLSRKEREDKTWLQISTGRWIQAENIMWDSEMKSFPKRYQNSHGLLVEDNLFLAWRPERWDSQLSNDVYHGGGGFIWWKWVKIAIV